MSDNLNPPAIPSEDWNAATLRVFRRDYLRDLIDTTTTPYTYYSDYNRAKKVQFYDDDAILAQKTRVETDFAEELTNVYVTKYNERISVGAVAADADTAATTVLLDATMRLVKAACREVMMADAGFVGSIADESQRAHLFQIWQEEISRDRTFERTRSGSFATVPIWRL